MSISRMQSIGVVLLAISSIYTFADSFETSFDEWMEQCASFEYTGVNPFRQYTPGGGEYLNGDGVLAVLPPADNNDNGILDSDEFAVLSSVLATPAASCHETVHAAFAANVLQAQNDIGTMVYIVPSLKYVMAAYATIGDGGYTRNPNSFQGSWGVFAKQVYELRAEDSRWQQGAPASSEYDSQQAILAFDGDCDGDDATNKDEYDALPGAGGPGSAKRQQYLQNVLLDSAAFRFILVPHGGMFQEGDDLELEVEVAGAYGSIHYQWIKDGSALVGETDDIFSVNSLTLDDSGVYLCQVSDEAKAVYETRPALVQVAPTGQVPTASMGGLLALMFFFVLSGISAEGVARR